MAEKRKKVHGEASVSQIEAWKRQYGAKCVFRVDVNDDAENIRVCYFRKPDLETLSLVARYADEPMKAARVLFENLLLGGDEAVREDGELMLSAALPLKDSFKIREATLKNV